MHGLEGSQTRKNDSLASKDRGVVKPPVKGTVIQDFLWFFGPGWLTLDLKTNLKKLRLWTLYKAATPRFLKYGGVATPRYFWKPGSHPKSGYSTPRFLKFQGVV